MTILQGEAASVAARQAEPIWFASYPAGVPRTIDPDSFSSLASMLIEACRQHAARPAFESLGARMSYAEWERDSKDFAGFLIEQIGCRAGDRVALVTAKALIWPASTRLFVAWTEVIVIGTWPASTSAIACPPPL